MNIVFFSECGGYNVILSAFFSFYIRKESLNISVIIGSEGGFSEKECALLAEKGAKTISLGKRILRCETAAVSAVTLTMYTMGEME